MSEVSGRSSVNRRLLVQCTPGGTSAIMRDSDNPLQSDSRCLL